MKRAVYLDEQTPLSLNMPCVCTLFCSTESTVKDIPIRLQKHIVVVSVLQQSKQKMPIIVYHDHICPNTTLSLDSSIIIANSTVKDLGVTFDSHLKSTSKTSLKHLSFTSVILPKFAHFNVYSSHIVWTIVTCSS